MKENVRPLRQAQTTQEIRIVLQLDTHTGAVQLPAMPSWEAPAPEPLEPMPTLSSAEVVSLAPSAAAGPVALRDAPVGRSSGRTGGASHELESVPVALRDAPAGRSSGRTGGASHELESVPVALRDAPAGRSSGRTGTESRAVGLQADPVSRVRPAAVSPRGSVSPVRPEEGSQSPSRRTHVPDDAHRQPSASSEIDGTEAELLALRNETLRLTRERDDARAALRDTRGALERLQGALDAAKDAFAQREQQLLDKCRELRGRAEAEPAAPWSDSMRRFTDRLSETLDSDLFRPWYRKPAGIVLIAALAAAAAAWFGFNAVGPMAL